MYLIINCSEKPNPQIVKERGNSGNGGGVVGRRSRGQSVLFTNDPKAVQLHKDTVSIIL